MLRQKIAGPNKYQRFFVLKSFERRKRLSANVSSRLDKFFHAVVFCVFYIATITLQRQMVRDLNFVRSLRSTYWIFPVTEVKRLIIKIFFSNLIKGSNVINPMSRYGKQPCETSSDGSEKECSGKVFHNLTYFDREYRIGRHPFSASSFHIFQPKVNRGVTYFYLVWE